MDVPEHSPSEARPVGDGRGIVLALVAVALLLYVIRIILLPFVLAGIVAYVCTPLLDWLAGRTRLPRALLAILLFLVLLGVAGAIVAFAGQRLVTETGSTIDDLQGTLDHLLRRASGDQPIHLFGQSIDPGQMVQTMIDRARDWFGQSDNMAFVAGGSLAIVMGTFLTAVLLIWFLVSGRSVARGLFWLVPPRRRDVVSQIWSRLDPVLKRYFLGVLAIVIYATIAAYIGLALILGLHHAALLALLTGIAETLPIVGSTAVAIIAGLVALHTATGIMSIVAFAIYATVLRLTIDQIVAPLVLGRAANVHPVLIIFCFLAGAVTFGITGVILSVPAALAVKTTLATLYGEADQQT
ncbi:MAG TPA: AI-2E family transporter [Xanthobacteraceae bacterium]|nr:AI-2E family transporter [Xanthobacteraceae bacterium]